jgi:hypothetical protein
MVKKTRKYKSAEHKRMALQLDNEWEQLKRKYDVKPTKPVNASTTYSPSRTVPPRGQSINYPSRVSTGGGGTVPIHNVKVYTGTKMIGIGTLHKSNAVPIFSDDDAKEIARMRRG